MPLYETKGTLTGTIEPENILKAQAYLTDDDMTRYLTSDSDTPWAKGVVELIRWNLSANGHDYTVTVFALRELTEGELKQLSSWVSGQNSDGLGEGFEQQEFAENHDGECGECWACEVGDACENDYAGMISFDWEKNKLPFAQVVTA